MHSSIHLAVCLTTGPKPLPKRTLHIARSRASSFKWEYPLLPLRSSSSFLRLLPRLPVTSIPPFIFPSITCCRRQFLQKMWPSSRNVISCWLHVFKQTDSCAFLMEGLFFVSCVSPSLFTLKVYHSTLFQGFFHFCTLIYYNSFCMFILLYIYVWLPWLRGAG